MPVRFLEREFGIEYTSYERKRLNDVYNAITARSKELSGYVVWLNRRKAFLIVPTLTSPQPKVFCEIPDWIEFDIPPNNAFITVKGSWQYRPKISADRNIVASKIFSVEKYEQTKPDIDSFKPDITYDDFREILFESLQNVDYYLQDLIAHSFVSSPKTINRLGGLTLSFYNESKGTSRHMLRHLRRYLPKELSLQHNYPLSVEEIGHSIRIDPFPWLYKQYNADADLTRDAMNLLKRPQDMPIEEITISLRSDNAAPKH